MSSAVQDNLKYVGGALLLHVLFAMLFVGMAFSSRQTVMPQLAIRAVMVDRATLNRLAQSQTKPSAEDQQRQQDEQIKEQQIKEQQAKEQELKRQQENAEKQKAAEAERQRQEKVKEQQRQDQLRLEAEAKQKAFQEQQRAQEAQRQQELQRQQAEAQAKQQAEQKRIAEIQQKQREAEQKRQADADAKAQAAREAELKQQLTEEEGVAQAINSGAQAQWAAQVQQKVIRSWIKPPSAKAGIDCDVNVTQGPGGTVLSAQVGKCNGDAAVRQSIENAVLTASPLPQPQDARLFTRNFTLRFRPSE